MNCPTCNGPMAFLFTSNYCPACEKRDTLVPLEPVQSVFTPAVKDCLYVGDDGELWWSHNGVSTRITQPSGLGPIIAFTVNRSMTSMEMLVHVMRHAMSTGTTHETIGNMFLPDDIQPKQWTTWMKSP